MTDDRHLETPRDLAQAPQLRRAAHDMYQEILNASLDHAGHDDLDVPAFLKRLNGVVVGFKAYGSQLVRLLNRYET
jgi:hypothetical protein